MTKLERSPFLLWRRTADAIIVLRPDDQEVVHIGGTGVALWDLLSVARTVDEIVAELAIAYGANPSDVAHDVGPVLQGLIARRFVVADHDQGEP